MYSLWYDSLAVKTIGGAIMIGAVVNPSRETERRYFIEQLNKLGIYETVKNTPLEKESYYSLRSMLAAKMGAAQ